MESVFLLCPHCNNEREIIDVGDLPGDVRETIPQEADFCLFCSICDIYSPAGFGGPSFNRVESTKFKFVSKPPLNGPCPCNSGKKYKRCCGNK